MHLIPASLSDGLQMGQGLEPTRIEAERQGTAGSAAAAQDVEPGDE